MRLTQVDQGSLEKAARKITKFATETFLLKKEESIDDEAIWLSSALCESSQEENSKSKKGTEETSQKGTNIQKKATEGTNKKSEEEKKEEDVIFDVKKLKGVDHFDKPKKIKFISFNIEDVGFADYVIRKSISEPLNYKLTPVNGREIKSISLKGLNAWKKEEHTVCKEVTIYPGDMTVLLFRFQKNEQDLYRTVVKGEDNYKFLTLFEFMVLVNQPKKETQEGAKKEKQVKDDQSRTESKEGGVGSQEESSDKSKGSTTETTAISKTTVWTGTLDIESTFDKKYFDFRLVRDKNLEVNRYEPSWSDIHTVTQGKVPVYTTLPASSSTGGGGATDKSDAIAKEATTAKDKNATTDSGSHEEASGGSDGKNTATHDNKTLQYDNKIVSVTAYLKDQRPMVMEIITAPAKEPISEPDSAKASEGKKAVTVSRYYTLAGNTWTETEAKASIELLNAHFKELAGQVLHRVLGEPAPEKEGEEEEREKQETTKINLQKNDYKIHFSMGLEDLKYVRTRPLQKVESIMNGTELVYQELLEDCEIGWAKGPTIELMEVHSRDSKLYFVNSNPENADVTKKWHETSQIRFIQIMDRLISSKNAKYVTITGKQERELVDKIPELESKEEESSFVSNKGVVSAIFMLIIVLM
ncbi:hypothetical protein MACJ_002611 [Theileria orientalis]|uniref:Uncharacterized protein n=1 Tax=Theileria orientalis TaxID=68886 RepID=A0A976QQM9_THEOR|nr:hypothetical protein MACJ_002611 [Theileria orientalis]